MIHLLFGYDCTSLGHSPFTIKVPSPEPLSIGNCTVYTAPWISAFVGGDITAGLLSCHLPSSGENALFLDLGTNGEMVLNHKRKLYTAATAAGPAFEGNGLSCGCPGISGAISHVVLRNLFPSLTTINNAHPIGICGSGAISLCAELLRKHYVTSDGVLTEKFKTDGIVLSKSPDGKINHLPSRRFTQYPARHCCHCCRYRYSPSGIRCIKKGIVHTISWRRFWIPSVN